MTQRPRYRALIGIVVLAATMVGAPAVAAAPPTAAICDARTNDNHKKLLECVTLAGVREHQQAFQDIADANGGTRASGQPGYEASVEYVVERMTAAGYDVFRHEFPFVYVPPAVLQQLTPIAATYDTGAFTGTGYADVTGAVTPVDLQLGLGNSSSSGCEAADFAGFSVGTVALLQRGTCSFAIKALNAEAAGASAAVIFNQGDADTQARMDLIVGTLGGTNVVGIPVVGASYPNGVALAQAGATARVKVDPPQDIVVENVIAQSKSGDPNNVVMAGAHLDSVQRGPGINDNGSGSAAILEVAEQLAKAKVRNQLRFAWWGAEEAGLIGSTAYVNGLSQAEKDKIALYLNFDMVGSPNHVFFIYDGDDSDAVGFGPGPAGSAQIEKTFERFFDGRGVPYKGTDFSGRSDYGPFIASMIPSGGLFTGAEGVKTAQEASIWGGTAGQQYDPCYHLACDTYANNNNTALDVNADAIAYATLQYAMSTTDVNAVRGKGNFKVPPPEVPPTQ